jgi:hypothetical protein
MRDEQFGFRPKHSTSLQLARLIEIITRNFGEKRITGAVFLDVPKAVDNVWIDGILYKITLLNFQSYKSIQSHRTSGVGRSKHPSRRPHHLVEACGLGWTYLSCPLQSVCRHALTLPPRRVSQWVDTTRYLGVTQDKRLTWSPHTDQVRKKTAQWTGLLGPLLKRKSDLSVRNGVLLYKQLIHPMMDYACPAWRSAARTHVWRLQVLQS